MDALVSQCPPLSSCFMATHTATGEATLNAQKSTDHKRQARALQVRAMEGFCFEVRSQGCGRLQQDDRFRNPDSLGCLPEGEALSEFRLCSVLAPEPLGP